MQARTTIPPEAEEISPGRLPAWVEQHRRQEPRAWPSYEELVQRSKQRLPLQVPRLASYWDETPERRIRAVEMPPRYNTNRDDDSDEDEQERHTLGGLADAMGLARGKWVLSAVMDELWQNSHWRVADERAAARNCLQPCRELAPQHVGQVWVATQLAQSDWDDVETDGRRSECVRTWTMLEMRRSQKYPWMRLRILCDRGTRAAFNYWSPPVTVADDPVEGVRTEQSFAINFGVHRFTCLAAHGPPPASDDGCIVAAHACDNPKCFNPSHLRWRTQSVNCKEHGGSEARSARASTQHRVGGRFARRGE
jgi:hypothetical protein